MFELLSYVLSIIFDKKTHNSTKYDSNQQVLLKCRELSNNVEEK